MSATLNSKCQELSKEIFMTDFSFITAEKDSAFTTSQIKQSKGTFVFIYIYACGLMVLLFG